MQHFNGLNSVGSSVRSASVQNGSGTDSNTDARLTQADSRTVQGHIYFIRAGDFVKIGYSTEPDSRLDALQTSNPLTLVKLHEFPGTREDEFRMHTKFVEHHVRGEWFRCSQKILDYIEVVNPEREELLRRRRDIRNTLQEWLQIRHAKAQEALADPPSDSYALGYSIGYVDALGRLLTELPETALSLPLEQRS